MCRWPGCCALIRFATVVVDHFRDTYDTTSVGYIDGFSRPMKNRISILA